MKLRYLAVVTVKPSLPSVELPLPTFSCETTVSETPELILAEAVCRTQRRSVSAVQPTFAATELIASYCEPFSPG